jgi:hypothetical protein
MLLGKECFQYFKEKFIKIGLLDKELVIAFSNPFRGCYVTCKSK